MSPPGNAAQEALKEPACQRAPLGKQEWSARVQKGDDIVARVSTKILYHTQAARKFTLPR